MTIWGSVIVKCETGPGWQGENIFDEWLDDIRPLMSEPFDRYDKCNGMVHNRLMASSFLWMAMLGEWNLRLTIQSHT